MEEGYRIWEIDNKTRIPKEIKSGTMDEFRTKLKEEYLLGGLDADNKTYAIRFGKTGLK